VCREGEIAGRQQRNPAMKCENCANHTQRRGGRSSLFFSKGEKEKRNGGPAFTRCRLSFFFFYQLEIMRFLPGGAAVLWFVIIVMGWGPRMEEKNMKDGREVSRHEQVA
jgi:hypothetical protein